MEKIETKVDGLKAEVEKMVGTADKYDPELRKKRKELKRAQRKLRKFRTRQQSIDAKMAKVREKHERAKKKEEELHKAAEEARIEAEKIKAEKAEAGGAEPETKPAEPQAEAPKEADESKPEKGAKEEPEEKPAKLDFAGTWKCKARPQSLVDSEGKPIDVDPAMFYLSINATAVITRQGSSYRVSGLTDGKMNSIRVEGNTLVMEGISDPSMGKGSDRETIRLTLKEEGRVLIGTQQTIDYVGNVATASIHCRR